MNVTNYHPHPKNPVSVPTGELVREAVDGARDLVQIELALALDEVRDDIQRMKKMAVWSVAGLLLLNVFLATIVLGTVLALGGTAPIAFAAAGVLAVGVGLSALIAYKLFPGVPLRRTLERVKNDMNQLRERIA